ncbi:MAG: hypothetical protein P4L40_01675 [Terracidiphilus sp.]|nr:hypothetical protein [Terracidiphilus sp.]
MALCSAAFVGSLSPFPSSQYGYTDGHCCVTTVDKVVATQSRASLLYGEILPAGALTG